MLCLLPEPVERTPGVLECGGKVKRRHRFRKGAQAGRRYAEQVGAGIPSRMPI
jgi:hypothetical protein